MSQVKRRVIVLLAMMRSDPRLLASLILDLLAKSPELSYLAARNRISSVSVLGSASCTVSLTTYGKRLNSAYLAVESIARGKVRPRRMVLWLSHEDFDRPLPDTLKRLAARGLEVRPCNDYGSHKKYYPYLEESDHLDEQLVTADDDAIYPSDWLSSLQEAWTGDPSLIHCHRAHRLLLTPDHRHIAPYASWPACTTTRPSRRTFPTGVGGVSYPPEFQRYLASLGTRFTELSPRADDVWLHYAATTGGWRIRQISQTRLELRSVPGTFRESLAVSNVNAGGNDVQIRATYSADALALLATPLDEGLDS